MKLLPLRWVTDHLAYTDHYTATVMGIELAVIPDPDGTFTASMTVRNKRPELQKGFTTIKEAMHYAEHELLWRQIHLYFTFKE